MAGGRFRELFKKYGQVALGVHLSVSAASLASIYVAIKSNVDVEGIFEKVGLGAIIKEEKLPQTNSEMTGVIVQDTVQDAPPKRNRTAEMAASSGGAIMLAILCNKALIPVRIPITIALTPPISRFLASRQLIKNAL